MVDTNKVLKGKELAGADESLRRPTLDEREEFDAEWRVQAPDARSWVVHEPIAGLDYREISVKDWERSGVQDGRYLRWDSGNDWRVPAGMLDFMTDGQRDQFLANDRRFKVVES